MSDASKRVIETREVLADAYLPNHRKRGGVYLTHSVYAGKREGEDVPLCNRVDGDSIADGAANPLGLDKPPTCPVCLRRDPRFKRPTDAPAAAG
jgi:hypothetical protein